MCFLVVAMMEVVALAVVVLVMMTVGLVPMTLMMTIHRSALQQPPPEVFVSGVGRVLRLERDAWSMVK